MNGALDVHGTFQITGGTILAGGSAGRDEAPDNDSPQAVSLWRSMERPRQLIC